VAELPGQKGRKYELQPAELETRKRAATGLLKAGNALPLSLRVAQVVVREVARAWLRLLWRLLPIRALHYFRLARRLTLLTVR
jgi:hypothetical protein